jgi:mannose-6-phosphate isomerase
LRAAILDGSVADLVDWRPVSKGDVIFVPAGTIHAIGPGLVIAEIQQRSDTTYRLFDYGRGRALDMDRAIDVANAGPAKSQQQPDRLNETRTILVANALFVVERITLSASLPYQLTASGETWVMSVDGSLTVSGIALGPGEVAFMNNGDAEMVSDLADAVALVVYPGPHIAPGLAQETAQQEVLV